jgi:hypothetical protein
VHRVEECKTDNVEKGNAGYLTFYVSERLFFSQFQLLISSLYAKGGSAVGCMVSVHCMIQVVGQMYVLGGNGCHPFSVCLPLICGVYY